jgi:DNA end-binding protein Ku
LARAIWSGSISFGLVNIPIKLYNATTPRDVRFHQFQRDTGRRVHYRRVVPPLEGQDDVAPASDTTRAMPAIPADLEGPGRDLSGTPPWSKPTTPQEEEVAYEDIVSGYEFEPNRFVTVTPDELDALEPEQTHTIEIEEFVDLAEIDPLYFEKSYYVGPKPGVGAEKPYALLLRSMERTNKVAVARFVLRTKEYLAAIRPKSDILVLETMFFADEVREPKEMGYLPIDLEVSERELQMAESLIGLLANKWDPARHEDTYRARVMDLIRSKLEGQEIVEAELPAEAPKVADLMAALKASVEAAKGAKAEEGSKPRRTGRKPA